jgi:hypothetical protein
VGSNPAEDEIFLRAIKVRSTPSFRREVKFAAPGCRMLWNVKDPYRMKEVLRRQNSRTFLAKFLLLRY